LGVELLYHPTKNRQSFPRSVAGIAAHSAARRGGDVALIESTATAPLAAEDLLDFGHALGLL
jgi:hypothetical protein